MLRENGRAEKGWEPASEDGTGRRPGPTFWLITGHENGGMELLTIDSDDGGETLPVFSFEEEAEMFLGFEALGRGWRVRETTGGELISVLYGLCTSVRRVALDPLPAGVGGEALVGLLSLEREDFARSLASRDGFSTPRRSLSPRVEASTESEPSESLREKEA